MPTPMPSFAWKRGLTLLLTLLLIGGTGRATAQVDEQAVEAARFLLSRSTRVARDRSFHEVLRSLRHLRDPQLRPLFEHLADASQPVLQIHGILGLAECSEVKQVDLKRVIAVSDPLAQAELVSAALDDELLSESGIEQLIASRGLDLSVRLLLANELVRRGRPLPAGLLDEAASSDNLGRKYLAALLKVQIGDDAAMQTLRDLNALDDPKRDGLRLLILDTALKYAFDRIAPWALAVATEPNVAARVEAVALRAAIRLGAAGAEGEWLRQLQSTSDIVQQTRLALTALRLAPWMDARAFAPLKAHSDPLLRQAGVAGEAIASKQNIAPAVVGLVQLHNPVANRIALSYAEENAPPQEARLILLALVLAYDAAKEELRTRMIDDAIVASQILYEKWPDEAVTLLRPIVADTKVDARLRHAIVLGLIRTQAPGAHRVVEGIDTRSNAQLRNVALLLMARSDAALSKEDMADLAMLVRGGGQLQETLRAQAAWAYLKRVGRAQTVLASIVGGAGP